MTHKKRSFEGPTVKGCVCACAFKCLFVSVLLAPHTQGVLTEVQPGSYIFMDCDYARNEVCPSISIYLSIYLSISLYACLCLFTCVHVSHCHPAPAICASTLFAGTHASEMLS